jgi:hypothetical protein
MFVRTEAFWEQCVMFGVSDDADERNCHYDENSPRRGDVRR